MHDIAGWCIEHVDRGRKVDVIVRGLGGREPELRSEVTQEIEVRGSRSTTTSSKASSAVTTASTAVGASIVVMRAKVSMRTGI